MSDKQHIRLSIQAGLYGLSFLLRDGETDIYQSVSYRASHPVAIEQHLKNLLETHRHSLDTESPVRLIHHHPWNTWVPEKYFEPSHAQWFIRTATPLLDTDTLSFDQTPGAGRVNVYVPMVNLNNLLLNYFPEIEFYHSATMMDRYALRHFPDDGRRHVWAHSGRQDFQLGIWEGKELKFFNTFPMENTDDFLYYFFFVWEKTGMKNVPAPDILITGPEAEKWAAGLKGFVSGIRTDSPEKELLTII